MIEQTKVKPSYAGKCKFCLGEFEKAKMTQHLKHCKERARIETEIAKSPKSKKFEQAKLFHIVLEGKYNPQYWMHIEVPAEAQLILLDDFIRDVWVECCDHLSSFQIGEFYYELERPEYDFSSFQIIGAEDAAVIQGSGMASEETEIGEGIEDSEEEEDYDKFELEEEIDPVLLETIPSDIVATLQAMHSRKEASKYLREELKVKIPAPDDRDRESVMQYFQRRDRQRAAKFLIEMIEDHTHACGLGGMDSDQLAEACGPVPRGPACCDPDMTPSAQRFATHTLVAPPFALRCRVLAGDPARAQRQGRGDLANQLLAGFVHTDHGSAGIVGPLVDPQHILHVLHAVGGGGGRHAPRFHLPQLAIVFLSAWRTVSRDARATYPSSTSRSASKRTVHRPCPGGGSPQANAINGCSPSPVIVTLSGRFRGRRGLRAASKLASTHWCRTRWMVDRRTLNASALASSGYGMPSGCASACSTMRPWSNLRAAPLPDDTIFRSTQRSSSVRVTRNLAMRNLLLLKPPCIARRKSDPDQPVNRRLPSY